MQGVSPSGQAVVCALEQCGSMACRGQRGAVLHARARGPPWGRAGRQQEPHQHTITCWKGSALEALQEEPPSRLMCPPSDLPVVVGGIRLPPF